MKKVFTGIVRKDCTAPDHYYLERTDWAVNMKDIFESFEGVNVKVTIENTELEVTKRDLKKLSMCAV